MKQFKIVQSITNREGASIDKYLNEISKIPLITAEEEVVLAQKIKEGDQAALQRLTKTNLRFVISVAKQFTNQGLPLGDLINEGNLGLITAAQRFDETRGFKFISYAVWWIRQSIMQAIAEQSRIVRLPSNQVGIQSKIRKASDLLESKFERNPIPSEVAEQLNLSLEQINDSMRNSFRHTYLDSPFVNGEENCLLDVISNNENPTDYNPLKQSLEIDIQYSLRHLKGREQEVIILFFGLNNKMPHSLDEIGERLSLSRERVRQLKDKALHTLRSSASHKLLPHLHHS
jgi:RNA polymerase primary sigma factor